MPKEFKQVKKKKKKKKKGQGLQQPLLFQYSGTSRYSHSADDTIHLMTGPVASSASVLLFQIIDTGRSIN